MSKIILAEQASAPDTPGSGKVAVYANNATLPALCWKDDAGNVNVAPDQVSGTFTPVLAFGGASTGITYGTQSGRYVRVGKMVHFWLQITLTSKGSATGTATITGLPLTQTGIRPTLTVYWSLGSAVILVLAQVVSTTINLFYTTAAATGPSLLTDAVFGNTSTLYISGTYEIA